MQFSDAAMHDAAFDDDRSVAEREAQIVKRIELKRERGFELDAAQADLPDDHRLEDHDLAVEVPEDFNTFRVAFVGLRVWCRPATAVELRHFADYSTRSVHPC